MHIIWKRPDGFQNANPEDFRKLTLSNGSGLWLHKQELDWYPFQFSGDWEGQEETKKLNRLVNLLDAPHSDWERYVQSLLDNNFSEDNSLGQLVNSLQSWLEESKANIKGNTWEQDIMKVAFGDIQTKLKGLL